MPTPPVLASMDHGHVSMSPVGLNHMSSPVNQIHRQPTLLESMPVDILRQQQDAYDNLSGFLGAQCAESVLDLLDSSKPAPSAPPPPPLSWMGSQGRSSTKSASPSAPPPSSAPPPPPPGLDVPDHVKMPPGLYVPDQVPDTSSAEDTSTPMHFVPEHALDGSSAGGATTPSVTLDVSCPTAMADSASRVARLASEGSTIDTDTCTVAKSDMALKCSKETDEPSSTCTDGPVYTLADIKSHYLPDKAEISPAYSLQPAEPPS